MCRVWNTELLLQREPGGGGSVPEHAYSTFGVQSLENSLITSGLWPRVRARALRAPVFLGSLPRPMGAARPPIAASLLPQQ